MRRRTLIIIIVAAALAIWQFSPLALFLYQFYQSYVEPALYNPEQYKVIREDLVNTLSRHGYRLCGEVTLGYGEISRAVFNGTFRGETMCLVFFNLPEPKGDYVVYQPAAVFTIMPARWEDMDKIYAYGFVFGQPGKLSHEAVADTVAEYGEGLRSIVSSYEYGLRGRDIFAIFIYKPPMEDPNMPVNVTIVIEATVLRYGEKHTPIRPPPEPRSGKDVEDIVKQVDGLLEDLGYSNCGEYRLDPGRHKLNLTFTFNPYEGKACYIKLLTKDLDKYRIKPLGGNHSHDSTTLVSVKEAWVEETGPMIDNAYSILLRAHPLYRRFMGQRVPNAFLMKESALGMAGIGELPNFLNESSAFYIYFSFRVAPESRIEPRDFEMVYRISLDLEVREAGG
jgi:hypothetical protein